MEIVNFQVGNCGMMIGTEFFKRLLTCREEERLIDDVFLEQFQPRTLLIDLDKENIAKMKGLEVYQGLDDDCFIANIGKTGNWSAGHYTEGPELSEKIEEKTRKIVEKCEKLQGFQMFHSAGGSSGGGLGTLIAEKLKDLYYEKTLQTITVFYKSGIDDRITEPYNTVFSMNSLIEFSNVSLIISNETLMRFLRIPLDSDRNVFKSLNQYIAKACLTGFYPIYKRENSFGTLLKYANNLVPFNRLHFLDISLSYEPNCINSIIDDSFSLGRRTGGKFFASFATCKMRNFKEVKFEIKQKIKLCSFNWVPKSFQLFNYYAQNDELFSLTSNGTGCLSLFKGINNDFEHLFKRKAFVHWYTGEGLDSMEFECAQGNFRDLIEEYQHYDTESELEDALNINKEASFDYWSLQLGFLDYFLLMFILSNWFYFNY